ncbi:helix-turn-helix transcriptional regulator [Chryseobacterium sp. MYb264]|uniref:helix-turn-helix domain-containing protein n=1 Tax=Chryseobacterium sp. MYb264 TaxID=2745153 RepID=UPI002E0F4AB6|nr:helix-turn-helix transcriptional regulator [Chryseobacterium sp. MYb264]
MFNTEIYLSTFINILIFTVLLIIISVQLFFVWKRRDRNFFLKFLGLVISGIIYNVVEGLLPDDRFGVNVISQNICAWIVGLAVALHYFIYIKNEYDLVFFKRFSLSSIGMFACITLILLFILPYTMTGSLEISRIFFLSFFLALFILAAIVVIKQQAIKYKTRKTKVFRFHDIAGIFAFFGLISLPVTILIFGDDQFIEQTSFSVGFFVVAVDFFLYGLRKKEMKKHIPFEKLSVRETEILKLLLENPNLKYAEISSMLHISEKTLSAHLSNIYKKAEIKSKKEIKELSKVYRDSIIA